MHDLRFNLGVEFVGVRVTRTVMKLRLARNMPGIVPILRGPINTQYIPILRGLAEEQSSNLFQYLQGGCSRIANIPF